MIYNLMKGLFSETQKWNRGLCFSRSFFIPFSSEEVCKQSSPLREVAASDRVFSLKGEWDYCYDNGRAASIDTDSYPWQKTAVPYLWRLEKGSGNYPLWNGKKIKEPSPKTILRTFFNVFDTTQSHFIYFTSVQGAFEVYVNGEFCGCSLTGEGEFDCSSFVRADAQNELVVVVHEYSRGDIFFSGSVRAHGISGDVLLSSHPSVSLMDYAFESFADGGSYIGKLSLAYIAKGDFYTKVTLCDRDKVLDEQELTGTEQVTEFRGLFVPYTPSDPHLYDIFVRIFVDEKEVECSRLRVGFYDRKISGSYLYCGHPLKIMAARYRSLFNDEGAVMTIDEYDRELTLLKKCHLNAVCVDKNLGPEFIRLCRERGVLVIESFGFDLSDLPEKGNARKFLDTENAESFVKEVCISRIMRDRSLPCVVGFSFGKGCIQKCFSSVCEDISLSTRFILFGGDIDKHVKIVKFDPSYRKVNRAGGVFLACDATAQGDDFASAIRLAESRRSVFGCCFDEFRDLTANGVIFASHGLVDGAGKPKKGGILAKYYLRPFRATMREDRYLDVTNIDFFETKKATAIIYLGSGFYTREVKRFDFELSPRQTRSFLLPFDSIKKTEKMEICYRDTDGNHIASEIVFIEPKEEKKENVNMFLSQGYSYSVASFDQADEQNGTAAHGYLLPCSSEKICDEALFDKKSDRALLLNGEWAFRYLGTNVPASFSSQGNWDTVSLPGTWQENGYEPFTFVRGYGFALKKKSYEIDEKRTPNTAALYRKIITVADLSYRYFLSFESISGAIQLYLNGKYIGCSSYRSAEFELTEHLIAGENEIVILMKKWSRNSFIYAQNDFAATGFLGDIALIKRHKKGLVDCSINTKLISNTLFRLDISALFGEANGKVRAALKFGGTLLTEQIKDIVEGKAYFDFTGEWKGYSEETPDVYDLYISVYDDDKVVECTKINVAMKDFSQENGVSYLNGRRFKIRGVVYNPIYSAYKKLISSDVWKKDLDLIKKYGFNAVQTTFVPPKAFLDLCLEKGVYVYCRIPVGEKYPVNDKKRRKGVFFEKDFTDRVVKQTEREYARTKLLPAAMGYLVMYEQGYPAIDESISKLLSLGAGTVVSFGAVGKIVGMNYPSVDKALDKMGEIMDRSSLLLTEYAPSYGIGCSDMEGFEEIISGSPCCMGGFVSRFVDEIIGDQGYRDDGLFSAERIPCTGAESIKYLYRKVRSNLLDKSQLEITNGYTYKDTSEYLIKLCIMRDGKVLSRTDLVATVPPCGSRVYDLFIDHISGDMYLNVEYYNKEKGELLYTEQHVLSEKMVSVLPKDGGKLRVNEFPDHLDIHFEGGDMRFDKKLGAFTRYAVCGKEVLKPERLERGGNCFVGNIERPFVRNILNEDKPVWTRSLRDFSWNKGTDDSYIDILVETSVYFKKKESFVIRDKYIVSGNGKVEVFSVINTMRRNLPNLDCFGKQLRLHNAFGNITYYGLGETASYVDMCSCARMGVFSIAVDKAFDGVYLKQECGNRMKVQYVVARDKEGDGIICVAEQDPFQLRVSPYSDKEIEKAFKGDTVVQSGVYLDINTFVSGFGSNRKEPNKKYTYLPGEYVLHFSVLPVCKTDK